MEYNRICLMLPTYGRSDTYLPAFINSAMVTADPARVCFAFCVNAKDVDTKKYLCTRQWHGFKWEMIEEDLPKPNLARYFNMLYGQTATRDDPGTVASMVGDDMVFETIGWDHRMLEVINAYKGVGVFWCNDAYIAREKCAVNLFVTRKMVEATEHPFMAEEFGADEIDVVWTEVGRLTRTSHFEADVIIRHNHNSRKAQEQWDPTFKRLNVIQKEVRARGGKRRALAIAAEIAAVLKRKGFTGDSVC